MIETEKIRNIVFDLGGVLIDIDPQRCIHRFEKLGLTNASSLMSGADFKEVWLRFEKGEIDETEFRGYIRSCCSVLKDVTDDQIDFAWNGMLVSIPRYKLDLLLELRSRYVVYLLSNTNSIYWKWALENPFKYRGFRAEDFFEKEYLSFRLNACKPEKAIFERVIEDANIDPKETLFIDDRIENTVAATELGIKTYTPKANENWSFLFD